MRKTAEQLAWHILLKIAAVDPAIAAQVKRVAKKMGVEVPTAAEMDAMFPAGWEKHNKDWPGVWQESSGFREWQSTAKQQPSIPKNKPKQQYTPEQEEANRRYDAEAKKTNPGASSKGYSGSKARSSNPYESDWESNWNSYQDTPYNEQEKQNQQRYEQAKREAQEAQEAQEARSKKYREEYGAEAAARNAEWDAERQEINDEIGRNDAAYTATRDARSRVSNLRNRAARFGMGIPISMGLAGASIGGEIKDDKYRDPFLSLVGAGAGTSAGYGLAQSINADRLSSSIKTIPRTVPKGFEAVGPHTPVRAAPSAIAGGLIGTGLGYGLSRLIGNTYYGDKKNKMKKAASEIAASVLRHVGP
jgi:hypothetical protein